MAGHTPLRAPKDDGSVSRGAQHCVNPAGAAAMATTRFLYDGADMIAELDASGAVLRRYVHGPGTDEPIVWYEGSGASDRRYLSADERGSIVAVSNSSGTVTSVLSYDDYGKPASGNTGRFGYTGQMWLAEAGLYHYKARAYHPGLGRFLQTDPIGVAGGMNLYGYAGNDPVNGRDPSGTVMCTGSHIDHPSGCAGIAGWGCIGDCSGTGREYPSPAVDGDGNCINPMYCEYGIWAFSAEEADAEIAKLEEQGWKTHRIPVRSHQTVILTGLRDVLLDGQLAWHLVVIAVDPISGEAFATRAGPEYRAPFPGGSGLGAGLLTAEALPWAPLGSEDYGHTSYLNYAGASNYSYDAVIDYMIDFAGDVNGHRRLYGILTSNSNSFACSISIGGNPLSGPSGYWTPGCGYSLGVGSLDL